MAGPFGFDTKSLINPANKYFYCSSISLPAFNVGCANAPNPSPYIQFYYLSFLEDIGICSITVLTENHYKWEDLKITLDNLANLIKSKYGKWNRKTESFPIWTGSSERLKLLGKNQGEYSYVWNLNKPINGIKIIKAFAFVNPVQNIANINIWYYTPAYDRCQEFIKKSGAISF